MNRQIILVVFVVLLVVSGVGFYILSRSKPQPVTPAASAPAPVVTPPPATAPEPPPVDAPPVTRRAAPPARAAAAPPPAAAPAPVDLVTLHVDSDVPGAQVFVDRQFIGAAPVTTTEVKPGTHQINVSAPGYDQYAQSIDIEPGPRDVMVRLYGSAIQNCMV